MEKILVLQIELIKSASRFNRFSLFILYFVGKEKYKTMEYIAIFFAIIIIFTVLYQLLPTTTTENFGIVDFTTTQGNTAPNPYTKSPFSPSSNSLLKLPAVNGDNIAQDQLQVVSNDQLDKLFNSTAAAILNKVIMNNLPPQSDIPQGTSQDTKYIDSTQVEQIKNTFVNAITSGTGKTFEITDTGTIGLSMTGNGNQLVKTYTIPIFLFDGGDFYTRRVILTVDVNLFKNAYGNAVVTNIQTPQNEQTVPIQPILPDAEVYPKLNRIDDQYYFAVPDDNAILFTPEDKAKALAEQTVSKQQQVAYNCYGVPMSEQIGTQAECILFGGVWDRPVQSDTECPFYQGNKNYTNDFGGSKNGYCELPTGMKLLGYRYYSRDPAYSPVCYNCVKGVNGSTTGDCCDKQTNLKSPDYEFNGDKIERANASSQLTSQGLSVM